MGKSYIESSLKRFLKRKVKITMGLVVTFMITGTVVFAKDTREQEHKDKIVGIETTNKNLAELGNGVISTDTDNKVNEFIGIEIKDGKTIVTNKKDANKVIAEIDNSLISTEIATKISGVLQEMTGNTNITDGTIIGEDGIEIQNVAINKGILEKRQEAKAGQIISNNGIIIKAETNSNLSDNRGQSIAGGAIGYNYGIIMNKGQYGQYTKDTDKENKLYNYGIIANGGNNGQYVSNGIGKNFGIILNNGNYGQNIISGTGYNYGIIANKNGNGQNIKSGIGYNYGIIMNANVSGQSIETGKIYNYGIIANGNNDGQSIGTNGVGYNYGMIANGGSNAIKSKGSAYNYGVVKNTTGKIFDGKVDNYGLVILTDKEHQKIINLGTGENKGIILDNNYNVIGEDTKLFTSKDTIKDFAGESSFDSLSKGYVKNESVNIDNTQDKVIGVIVTEKLDKAVFNYSGDDLFLKGTSLVGYFEQNGTLLDVGTGNLTLAGNTNITAVKNDFNLDVTAVKLGDDATITIADEAKINGLISGGKEITFANTKGNYTLADSGLVEVVVNENPNKNLNYVDITLQAGKELTDKESIDGTGTDTVESTISGLKLSTGNTTEELVNKVTIKDGLTVGKDEITVDGKNYSIYDENKNEKVQLEMTVENLNDLQGDVLLGAGEDTFVVYNKENKSTERVTVDLGAGKDTFKVKYGETASYEEVDKETGEVKETGYSVFDYKVNNAENVVLSGKGQWTIGENAHIGFTDSGTKAGNTALLKAADGATLNIIMNEGGSNLNNIIKNGGLLEKGDKLVLGTDKDSLIKYQIGKTGLPFKTEDTSYTADYGIEKDANVVAPIFNVTSDGKTTSISLKTAQQAGVGNYAPIYNAYIKQVANKNWDVIKYINSLNSDEALVDRIIKTDVNAKAYYTAGTVVTKNITDSYLSAVEDFKERAGKGEWLAQGKFINSDTEFDGGSKVKGYDGDINSAVGMVEYGLTENTSYGVAFGGGDTEIDIDGGGKLDGDNYYLGFYTKHRTANGIDLVGNFGIMKSDLDSTLGNEFSFTVNDSNISDKTFEKGTADSTAFALSLKGKKDFYVTDSVKLQPVVGARMTLINQDKAENPAMNFEIKEQDVFIAEGILGANIAKEFALENGKLEFNTGIEYVFAASTENEDAEYRLFNNDDIKIENSKIASSKGTAHVGVDYEYENGVGFNGKYEMMWSDKGDDSRVTAGISYRF